jgi:uncharacterized protein
MSQTRTYPDGVPSWIDTEQPDPEAAKAFYGGLFDWTFTDVSPEGAPFYSIASLDGRDLAGLSSASSGASWNTYIAVDDADATAARVTTSGGTVHVGPVDVGPAGRMAVCADPAGARFALWQARDRLGAQVVNEPGTWNFSDLHTDEPDPTAFYRTVFGWEVADMGFATLLRAPGYGDHLEATVDPGIRERQRAVSAPPGFEDAVAWVGPLEPGHSPHWHVTIAVGDRDATVQHARALGAEVLDEQDSPWTRTAVVRDPHGAVFTVSQFTPPG